MKIMVKRLGVVLALLVGQCVWTVPASVDSELTFVSSWRQSYGIHSSAFHRGVQARGS